MWHQEDFMYLAHIWFLLDSGGLKLSLILLLNAWEPAYPYQPHEDTWTK